MHYVVIRNSRVIAVAELKVHEQPPACIFDEVHDCGLYRVHGFVVPPSLRISAVYRYDEHVVVQHQQPAHFLEKFAGGHQRVGYVEHFLHRRSDRHRVGAVDPDVHGVQLLYLVNNAPDRLLDYI